MSKKDELKLMVELYKALLITLFGVLGYTFIHYEDFTTTKIINSF